MLKEKQNFYTIIAFSLILGILADYLFYGKIPGISFLIFIIAAIAFSLFIAKKFEQKISKTQILLLASAIILSAGVFLRASSFLGFFNVIVSIYLLFLAAALFAEKNISGFRFLRYFTAPILFFFRSLASSPKFVASQKEFIASKDKFGSPELHGVIKGIIMSLPILAILGWFLYSADTVVQIYVNKLFDLFHFKINFDLASEAFIILAVSYIFIGVFAKITKDRQPENPEEKIGLDKPRGTGFIESMTVLALVELLFLAFIAIQFFYLFGGRNYVWGINEYITYSEYARSGFYELIKVAIVSFLLIYAIAQSSRIETLKEKKIFRFLSAALFIEISLILMSAIKRLLLYADGYGLTLSRFLAFAFLFWIFGVFLLLLYKIFLEKKNSVFICMVFALSVAVWIGINIANPDSLIARVNIDRFAEGKKLDPYYFSNLSEDAVPELVKIFRLNIDDEIKERLAMDLDWKYVSHNYTCDLGPSGIMPYDSSYGLSLCKPVLFSERIKTMEVKSAWQSFNLSKANALQVLKNNAAEIDKYETTYLKKQRLIECKNKIASCEANCATNAWQPIKECKESCNLEKCE